MDSDCTLPRLVGNLSLNLVTTTSVPVTTTIPQGLPAGPRSPAWWQLVRYSLWPLDFLEECGRKYGETFTFQLAGFPKIVMFTRPEDIDEILRGSPKVLHSGEGNEFLAASVGQKSVLVLDEEAHAQQRRVLVPPLKGERMRGMFDRIQTITTFALSQWPDGEARPSQPFAQFITLRVILQAVLGLRIGSELLELERLLGRLFVHARTQWALILDRTFASTMLKRPQAFGFFRELWQIDKLLLARIEAARANPLPPRSCALADLLAARHEDGSPLGDEEIRDAVVTLLFAGHETTSAALAWTLKEIGERPEVGQKIQEELGQVVGNTLPTDEHLEQLSYLDAVIRESLRLHTIIPFIVRKTKRPFTVGGREYPAGVLLTPGIHLVHRRPDLYPQPEQFRPERFLERKFSPSEWLPFGGGNRVCLGMALSLYELKAVLATVLASRDVSRPARAVSRVLRQGLVLSPSDGARVILKQR
jgi:cytochrome P450